MNINPWKSFDRDHPIPGYEWMTSTPEYKEMYQWEPSTEVFFHTRVSNPDRKELFKVNGMAPDLPSRELPPEAGFFNRPADESMQPSPACRNPYFVEVTEVESDGIRLHNWLHITGSFTSDDCIICIP